jgi:hypothetical protein
MVLISFHLIVLQVKQKEFGLVCVADKSRISNGDRTLFPNLKNINRDLGIKAFKQENYKEAIKLFGQAVKLIAMTLKY